MAGNSNFSNAKREKNDEFYTLRDDVAKELSHYEKQLYGKSVFCNCNDDENSAFWCYLSENFDKMHLKKLTAVKYGEQSYRLDMTEKGKINKRFLDGDGDFRSKESMEILENSDIIITNPPFSLFREYIGLLLKLNKDFLIVGSMNMIVCREIFPYFMEEKLRLGYNSVNNFVQTNGQICKFGNILWYTTLKTESQDKPLVLSKRYNSKKYPYYDNYPAIDVGRIADIPCDYYGIMGVPISYLTRHDPQQFKVIGLTQGNDGLAKRYENLIQYRVDGTTANGSKANTSAVLSVSQKPNRIYYKASNAEGYLICRYVRVLIQRKQQL